MDSRQQVNVFAPTCLDIWLNEPRNAPESRAPANLLRLWFPESILAHDSNDNLLWEYTFERRSASWQYVNESIGDMKRGQAVRKVLQSVDAFDGLALIDCSARWRETDIDLTLRITNVGSMAWSRLQASICLQRPAAPDYLDEENTRTYLVSDEGFVASADLVFPPRRRLVYAWVGEELPMREGTEAPTGGSGPLRGLERRALCPRVCLAAGAAALPQPGGMRQVPSLRP